MKKQTFSILLVLTGIFLAFTTGLFIGRNYTNIDIQISKSDHSPIYADKIPDVHIAEPDVPNETIVFPLDINSATQTELTALPGIGETLAGRILDYRNIYGNFSSPEELLNVPGIGAAKLESILNLITTGG